MSNRTFSTKTVLALVLAAVPLTACDSLFNIVDDLRDGLADAEIDLAQAVAKAEAEVPSGTIVDAEFEFEHGRLQYRFVIWQDGEERRLELAADDGRVLKNRSEAVDADDAAELSAQALIVESASLSSGLPRSDSVTFSVELPADLAVNTKVPVALSAPSLSARSSSDCSYSMSVRRCSSTAGLPISNFAP